MSERTPKEGVLHETAGPRLAPSARLVDRAADDASPEGRAGAVLRQLPAPGGLDAVSLARVRRRLERAYEPRRSPARGVRGVAVVGLVALLIGVAGGLSAAAGSEWTQWATRTWRRVTRPAVSAPVPVSPPRVRARPVEERRIPLAPPVPLVAPPQAPVTAAAVRAIPSARRVALRSQAVPPASRLAEEAAAVAPALSLIRQRHDGEAALQALDRYDGRFGSHGLLGPEARAARVDALLLLGRRDEAAATLRAANLGSAGRDVELRLLRAELTAATSCANAVEDFSRVVSEGSPSLVERALYGRACCQLRLGARGAAQTDFAAYLERFPRGRFAAAARAQTKKPGGPQP